MHSKLLTNIALGLSGLVLLCAAAAGGYLAWKLIDRKDASAQVSNSEVYASLGTQTALTDHHGKATRLSDMQGKVTLLFFGYTNCPAVCPATLYSMAQANALLKSEGHSLNGVFISIDPQRDSAQRLSEYVPYFDADFIGLTGSEQALAQVAKDFGASFEKGEVDEQGGYLMAHTTFGYLINKQGKVVELLGAGESPEAIAKAVRALL